ncbi:MAG: deoxyribodipyrimidine photo-lyase, partial [Pseudomonadota bacterium]
DDVAGDDLAAWALLPTKPDWAGGLRESWQPGEAGAHERLRDFVTHAADDYAEGRDRPGKDHTSRLSPHLHFGEISPNQVWQALKMAAGFGEVSGQASDAYLRELGWRDFSYHLLTLFPELPEANFRDQFDRFPWRSDNTELERWQRGQTGYPLVDAGMRQLWHTGWMHNRVRMVVGSFLVKHLRQHWRAGEDWFWDTLVDADLASNAASWQWVAGSGADAAPYFRIFNPMSQGEKFDPDGAYVRRWVPELAKVPQKFLNRPWEAPVEILRQAGVELGKDYPNPIVDHRTAREAALAAFQESKG